MIPLMTRILRMTPRWLQYSAVNTWRSFKGLRRRVAEGLGSARYSRVALHGLDVKLAAYLPAQGVFVEAGANDGVQQSNTYYLERFGGWTGLLIEPVPNLAARARKRRQAVVVNAALVSSSHKGITIEMRASGLTSMVPGTRKEHSPEFGSEQTVVEVPARTLSAILDEHAVDHIDFLSLDVEGYEPEALAGLDFGRHAPIWMLVECLDGPERVEGVLAGRYDLAAKLSPHDYLYRRR
jgi:FkbM family methyltransferase